MKFVLTNFHKIVPIIIVRGNTPRRSRADATGRTDKWRERETHMKNLLDACCDYVNAPKINQRKVVTPYWRFGTNYRSHLHGSRIEKDSCPLNIGPIGCPETSVKSYLFVLRNFTEQHRSQLIHGVSLKSRKYNEFLLGIYRSIQTPQSTRVGTLIVATIYLQLIQNRYMFRSFTVLQCSHQHCVQPVASDVEIVGYL